MLLTGHSTIEHACTKVHIKLFEELNRISFLNISVDLHRCESIDKFGFSVVVTSNQKSKPLH